MPTQRKTQSKSRATSRQDEQLELVERGQKIPGVAEAMAAYGAVMPYVPKVDNAVPTMRYATGANR